MVEYSARFVRVTGNQKKSPLYLKVDFLILFFPNECEYGLPFLSFTYVYLCFFYYLLIYLYLLLINRRPIGRQSWIKHRKVRNQIQYEKHAFSIYYDNIEKQFQYK